MIAASIALALGTGTALAQQRAEERAENVESAERRLDTAEDRLERAEQAVEQRENELEDARETSVERRDADDDRPFARERDVEQSDRESDRRSAESSDLDGIAEEHQSLSRFIEALRVTGLDETLTSGTAYTVFAPTNEAFDDQWEELQGAENREELIELLRAHIVADDVDAERARTLTQALTVDGGVVDIAEEDGELMIGDAKVVDADIGRGNLRIYAIDDVLDVDPSAATAALRESARDAERDLDRDRELDRDDRPN